MPISLSWDVIAFRLLLTLLAGTLIGLDRSGLSRPAGLRTSLLVCLAASIAMIQANLLLETAGRPPHSFVTLDLMRLPLGILSGMGFIGAGAMIHQDDLVLGVSTAVILWFLTVIGLCFGGGQMALGLSGLALGLLTFRSVKWVEQQIPKEQSANFSVFVELGGPTEDEIRNHILSSGFQITSCSVILTAIEKRREYHFEVRWRKDSSEMASPQLIYQFAQDSRVLKLQWKEDRAN